MTIENNGGTAMQNETCKHGTEILYRCPDNADHDEHPDGLTTRRLPCLRSGKGGHMNKRCPKCDRLVPEEYADSPFCSYCDAEMARFTVMRDCCVFGNCDYCTGKRKYGQPLRILHADNMTAEQAERIADKWRKFGVEVIRHE